MKLISLSLALLFASSAFAVKTRNCSPTEAEYLDQLVSDSHAVREQIISDIDETVQTQRRTLKRKVIKKLLKAKGTLQCVRWRTKSMTFNCQDDSDLKYIMRVLPIVGNEVDVATRYLFRYNHDFMVGTIIHEASHKCGTNDARYFIQNGEKPHSTWRSGWHNIASTYDYWATYGFCIPEVDC